jgi:hypothetical protein
VTLDALYLAANAVALLVGIVGEFFKAPDPRFDGARLWFRS